MGCIQCSVRSLASLEHRRRSKSRRSCRNSAQPQQPYMKRTWYSRSRPKTGSSLNRNELILSVPSGHRPAPGDRTREQYPSEPLVPPSEVENSMWLTERHSSLLDRWGTWSPLHHQSSPSASRNTTTTAITLATTITTTITTVATATTNNNRLLQ